MRFLVVRIGEHSVSLSVSLCLSVSLSVHPSARLPRTQQPSQKSSHASEGGLRASRPISLQMQQCFWKAFRFRLWMERTCRCAYTVESLLSHGHYQCAQNFLTKILVGDTWKRSTAVWHSAQWLISCRNNIIYRVEFGQKQWGLYVQ